MADQNDLQVAQQLGELTASVKSMQSALQTHATDSKKSRAEVYAKVNSLSEKVAVMDKTVSDLDSQMKRANTSITNFENLKAQAKGASRTIQLLWIIAGTAVLGGIGYIVKIILGVKLG